VRRGEDGKGGWDAKTCANKHDGTARSRRLSFSVCLSVSLSLSVSLCLSSSSSHFSHLNFNKIGRETVKINARAARIAALRSRDDEKALLVPEADARVGDPLRSPVPHAREEIGANDKVEVYVWELLFLEQNH
jgi:hypothetical protein